jgi:hypothetical protein
MAILHPSLDVSQQHIYGVWLLTQHSTPNLEDCGLHFICAPSFGLPDVDGSTRSLRCRQHSWSLVHADLCTIILSTSGQTYRMCHIILLVLGSFWTSRLHYLVTLCHTPSSYVWSHDSRAHVITGSLLSLLFRVFTFFCCSQSKQLIEARENWETCIPLSLSRRDILLFALIVHGILKMETLICNERKSNLSIAPCFLLNRENISFSVVVLRPFLAHKMAENLQHKFKYHYFKSK